MTNRINRYLDGLNDYYIVHATWHGFLFVVCVYQSLGLL